MNTFIYKIVSVLDWRTALASGHFKGSTVDLRDGFVHFSTASQVRETLRRHFSGRTDLILLAVAAEGLGDGLRWELSRGGELFPHLYGPLPSDRISTARALLIGTDAEHDLGELAS